MRCQKNLSYAFLCLLFIQLYNEKPPYARYYAEIKELPLAIASKGYQRILTSHDHVITHIKHFSSSLSFFHGQNISKIGRTYLLLGGAEDYLRCYKRSSFNVSWLEIENNHMEVIMIQRECMEGIWRHCTMPGLFQNMVCIFYFFLLNLKIPQNDILSFIIFITITILMIFHYNSYIIWSKEI